MKIQIRKGVFETNSSSTHSLYISRDSKFNTDDFIHNIFLDENNNIVLEGGEFGWEEVKYFSPLDKANYIAVGIKQILEFAPKSEIGRKNAEKYLIMLIEVLQEQTNCNDVIFDFTTKYDGKNWSYIDHQSYSVFLEALTDKDTLKGFIFNPNSYLQTDNDNH